MVEAATHLPPMPPPKLHLLPMSHPKYLPMIVCLTVPYRVVMPAGLDPAWFFMIPKDAKTAKDGQVMKPNHLICLRMVWTWKPFVS